MRTTVLTLLDFKQPVEASNVNVSAIQECLVCLELSIESKLQGSNVCIVPSPVQGEVILSVNGATLLLGSKLYSYPSNSRTVKEHSIERSLNATIKGDNNLSIGSKTRSKGDRGILGIQGGLVGIWQSLEGNVYRGKNAGISG